MREQPPPAVSQPPLLRHAPGDLSVLASVLATPEWPEGSAFPPGGHHEKGDDDDIISGRPTAKAGKIRATAATLNSPAPPGGGLGIPFQLPRLASPSAWLITWSRCNPCPTSCCHQGGRRQATPVSFTGYRIHTRLNVVKICPVRLGGLVTGRILAAELHRVRQCQCE